MIDFTEDKLEIIVLNAKIHPDALKNNQSERGQYFLTIFIIIRLTLRREQPGAEIFCQKYFHSNSSEIFYSKGRFFAPILL